MEVRDASSIKTRNTPKIITKIQQNILTLPRQKQTTSTMYLISPIQITKQTSHITSGSMCSRH